MTEPIGNSELLSKLLQKLDEPLARYSLLDNYYTGNQPLAFLSPESKTALGNRFGRMASNLPRLAVTALAERLRIIGFSDEKLWAEWLRNDMDQLSGVAHREALLLGDSFVIVWADLAGRPNVTVESAKQIAVERDPGTREIIAAVKRWETETTTEAVLYLPDTITRYSANSVGATLGFQTVKEIPNPLGVVPLVDLRNSDRILDDYGSSEIEDMMPLVDGLNKSLVDMMTTSEYVGRPRRWATGIELEERPVIDSEGNPVLDDDDQPVVETVNPIPEGNRAMIAESHEAKFGQLASADLGGYEASVNVLLGQIMAVSTLPAHYVGIFTDNPASADALRASEASLTARAEARQQTFGRAWEQVAKLMLAVRDRTDPRQISDVSVKWADAATRSVAQEADATVKLFQSGLLPRDYALKKLGFSDLEISEIRAATPVVEQSEIKAVTA
ncbi:phage portal protein [Mycolicibacterium fortuitum]|uniref:Phage portal protein n=1 Tax=Mycolicibacterium fortuitum TaxID=1766 RepID=A0AAE4VH49_MYCFO|nr:phage portal protein [Mycolicibacterium fortuitum]MDV7194664.1 phage portal protein [Mycolicibacterium fortuitum]MDV7208184.1 phage portal protein [Mycolicibacterium fortuitum]MDV7230088.1 phage portal protein [Mycolicibacterium fortuitum]MDV7261781.1 phage portal protein [Mycolicibacterium fortuitum]MDV7287094.1 phage portal protein [Mycolicibacterium fortuitum]